MIRPMPRLRTRFFRLGISNACRSVRRIAPSFTHVVRLLTKLPGHPELVIDFTGVGRPVFDMFECDGIYPIGVVITGGMTETRDGRTYFVPKLDLVSRLQ